jgi:segregation and condensation protein B
MTSSPKDLSNIIEAALFSSETPLSVKHLQLLFSNATRPTREEILKTIAALADEYEGRGVELIQVGIGYRFQTHARYADWLHRLRELRPPRYSKALLETLAIITYRQPVTRGDIEEIRGVTVTTEIMRALLDREWIRQTGVRAVPGHPALYGTTAKFLEYFGLKSLTDLPELEDPRRIADIVQDLGLDVKGEGLSNLTGGEAQSVDSPETSEPIFDTGGLANQELTQKTHADVEPTTSSSSTLEVAEGGMLKVAAPAGE